MVFPRKTKKIVADAGGLVEKLEINYRSDPRPFKIFKLGSFSKIQIKPIESFKTSGKSRTGKLRLKFILQKSDLDETNLIIEQILEWRKLGVPFQDMAILVLKKC